VVGLEGEACLQIALIVVVVDYLYNENVSFHCIDDELLPLSQLFEGKSYLQALLKRRGRSIPLGTRVTKKQKKVRSTSRLRTRCGA